VRYEVGSKEDPPGRAGLAHLVEHLMFQQQAGPDQPSVAAVLQESTLSHNAFTSWDSTHYQAKGRPEALETLLGLEAARLAGGCDGFSQAVFLREREVVRNEIRQRLGTSDGQVLVRLLEDVYPPGHPYRRMIGGDDEQLARIEMSDVCRFLRDYYVPERATVIIAGKLDEVAARAAAARLSGRRDGAHRRATGGGARGRVRHAPAAGDAPDERRRVQRDRRLAAARPLRPRARRHRAHHQLGRRPHRRLRQRLRILRRGEPDRPRRAERAGAGGAGVAARRRRHRRGQERDLPRRPRRPPGLEYADVDELRAKLVAMLAMRFEPLAARGAAYGDYAQFMPGGGFGAELESLRRLDADRMTAQIKRVLDPDRAMVVIFRARPGAGVSYRRAAAAIGGAPDVPREELPVDAAEAERPIPLPERLTRLGGARRFELANGLRVVLLRTESPVPVITASLHFAVGSAHDPPGMGGLAAIAAAELQPPLRRQKRGRWYAPFARFGIARLASVDADATVFVARGLAEHQDAIVDGLARMVDDARYVQPAIEDRQRRFKLSLRRRGLVSELAVEKALAESLFGERHPYAVAAGASAATRGRVGLDEATAFARKHYSARNATLILAGPFDEAAAERAIRRTFGAWGGGHADPPIAAPAERHAGRAVGVVGQETPQLRVHLAFPVPRRHRRALRRPAGPGRDARPPRRRRARAAGRVVRRRRPLPAARRSRLHRHRRRGRRRARAEALAALRQGLADLRAGDGFLEEFVRARRAVLEERLADAGDSAFLAFALDEIATFDLPPSFADELVARIARLTPSEVLILLQTELDPGRETLVCEGSAAALGKTFTGAGIPQPRVIDASP
jgi:zinc protease